MLDKRALEFQPCLARGYAKPLISCLSCRKYPCRGFEKWREDILAASPFADFGADSKLISKRSSVMYLFRMNNGSIVPAYKGFDPAAPDFKALGDVEEVLVISKVLVKQVRLVAKSAEERSALLAAESIKEAEPKSAEAKPAKKRTSAK